MKRLIVPSPLRHVGVPALVPAFLDFCDWASMRAASSHPTATDAGTRLLRANAALGGRHVVPPGEATSPLQWAKAHAGPSEAAAIARRERQVELAKAVDDRAAATWYAKKPHLKRQDRLVRELGSVEAAVRETLQPSNVSFREELRRRPLDRKILEEIYRDLHGKRAERHLRKGLHWEHWIARGDGTAPVLKANERAKQTFGMGGSVDLIAQATVPRQFPVSSVPEVAFIGRTNCGKSSLINSVVNSFACRYGALPGTTVSADFFSVAGQLTLVDLPGYGHYEQTQTQAAVAQQAVRVLRSYLHAASRLERPADESATFNAPPRRNVKRVYLCAGPTSGLTSGDLAYMELLQRLQCPFGIIITKSDTVSVKNLARIVDYIRAQAVPYPMCAEIFMSSSLRLSGITKLQNQLSELSKSSANATGASLNLDDFDAIIQ